MPGPRPSPEPRPFAQSFRRRHRIISTDFFTQRRTIGQPKGRLFAVGPADMHQWKPVTAADVVFAAPDV